jgi:deoxyribodipyrimidine photo-lyase
MAQSNALVWVRRDLRLNDNPALAAAGQADRAFVVFIWPEADSEWPIGEASRWWLHQSLRAFAEQVKALGSQLIIAKGKPLAVLGDLSRELGVTQLYWNRRYESQARQQDSEVKRALTEQGLQVISCRGNYLLEPWELTNKSGDPYKVFTPFARAFMQGLGPIESMKPPQRLSKLPSGVTGLTVSDLNLLPTHSWYQTLAQNWQPGEGAAITQLKSFAKSTLEVYHKQRDFPATAGTSRLGPHLHFGEISPRYIWRYLDHYHAEKDIETFQRQLVWREFANYSLFHFPTLPEQPIKVEFSRFPWSTSKRRLAAWQQGRTGFPIVDAGMRELWNTGWMHNRVRMIVGSFLVKNLRIHWYEGESWFWDTLVDADLPNNSMGWQWVAGCGIDAAPYFRIFNPTLQSEKFDPDGQYLRQWLPELAGLPTKWLHAPDQAPQEVLVDAGVQLGHNYPRPIIDYKQSRQEALAAYHDLKS